MHQLIVHESEGLNYWIGQAKLRTQPTILNYGHV